MENQKNNKGNNQTIDTAELAKLTGIPIDEIKRNNNIPCFSDAQKKYFQCERGSAKRENALISMIELAGDITEIIDAYDWAYSDAIYYHRSVIERELAIRGDGGKIPRRASRKWAELTSNPNEIETLFNHVSFIPKGKRWPVYILETEVRLGLFEKWLKLADTKEKLSKLFKRTSYLDKYEGLNTRILIKELQFIESLQEIKEAKSRYESIKANKNARYAFNVDLVINATVDRFNKVSLEKAESANNPKEYRKIYCEVFNNPTARAIMRKKWDEFSLKEASVATTPEDYQKVCASAHGDSEAKKEVLAKWKPQCLAAINSAMTIEEADKASRWITAYDSEVKKIYIDKCNELSLKEFNSATTKEEYANVYKRAYNGSEAKKLAHMKLTEMCTLSQ